jgi:hypothetical protein
MQDWQVQEEIAVIDSGQTCAKKICTSTPNVLTA